MVTEGSSLPSVVGAPLIVAEDGTSQTMNWLMSSSVGCESMLIGVWAPEEVRPEKTEVVQRTTNNHSLVHRQQQLDDAGNL